MSAYDVIVIGTALTAMANALRVRDRILERLGVATQTEVMA